MNLRPILSITFPQGFWKSKNLDIGLLEVGAKRCKKEWTNKEKKSVKKTFSPRRFYILYKQEFLNLRSLLSITFPPRITNLSKFGHPISGSGGKKTVKQYLKSEQTHRQTDRQTDRHTYEGFHPGQRMTLKNVIIFFYGETNISLK